MISLVTVLIAVRRNGISILWEDDMKKIYLWLKKHLKCWNEGHDYYYSPYAEYFICRRCGHLSKYGKWIMEK